MKNKWIIACLLGVMVFGSTGCPGKTASDNTSGTQTASEAGAAAETESAGQTQTDKNISSSIADVQRVSEREDYIGLQDLDIDKYVTLNDYKNMKVEVYKPQTQDQDIEQYIDSELLKGYIKDRAVADGDVANIDYEGKKDGVAFEGGTASGFDLEIGSGSFIPGFEEKLIGVMPGETVDLDLTFPEAYVNRHLQDSRWYLR